MPVCRWSDWIWKLCHVVRADECFTLISKGLCDKVLSGTLDTFRAERVTSVDSRYICVYQSTISIPTYGFLSDTSSSRPHIMHYNTPTRPIDACVCRL